MLQNVGTASQVECGTTMQEEEPSTISTNNMIAAAARALGKLETRQQQMNFWRKLALSLVLLLIIGSIFAIVMEVILPQEGQWADFTSHRCTEWCENSHQCDHSMEERPTVQQPANAYTNLAYIWCGLVPMVFFRIADLGTFMYFCASTLLAIGSFMFHASISGYWASIDGDFMFTYGIALIFHGVHVVFGVPWTILALILVALFVATPLAMDQVPVDVMFINMGMFVIVVVLVAILVLARMYMIIVREPKKRASDTRSKTFWHKTWQISVILGLAIVPAIYSGIAVYVWEMDRQKMWCNPASPWQWHGAWHVLTAFASLWTWVFFDKNRLKDIISTSYPPTIDDDRVEKSNKLSKESTSSMRSTEIFEPGESSDEFQVVIETTVVSVEETGVTPA